MKMDNVCFGSFVFDRDNRQLRTGDAPVELSNRCFDALALLLGEPGALISKDRFMEKVWRGVPVTDEALTQCIKTLRRALGDDAARPRFIETVPKHGYRFIAPIEQSRLSKNKTAEAPPPFDWRRFALLGGAGVVGGGVAGLIGGLVYGLVGSTGPGIGAASTVLVLTSIAVLVALIGAVGVSFGIATALVRGAGGAWLAAGGALGGFAVGGSAKLLGIDAFNLLLGASPGNFTGAIEGAALGAAVGAGVWLTRAVRPQIWRAAAVGGLAGASITALGGQLLAGSLDLFAIEFPQSRLGLDRVGAVFGEDGFGPIAQIVSGAMEGSLFAGCIAAAMLIARRQLAEKSQPD